MMLDFHLALVELAKVTDHGCRTHGPLGGWRSIPDFQPKYQNAKARHALAGLIQDLDDESGLHHLAHEAWNALALLQYKIERG
jgi:hypothetical protein